MSACDRCGLVLSSRDALHRHTITRHSDNRPFVCHDCGKSFNRKDNLNTHLLTHGGVKAFKCDVCDFVSKRKYVVKIHQRQHMESESSTGSKRCKCDFCHLFFKDERVRNEHVQKMHSSMAPSDIIVRKKERQWPCKYCQKTLDTQDRLRKHLKNSCGMVPEELSGRGTLSCLLCRGKYKSLPDLYVHRCPGKPS